MTEKDLKFHKAFIRIANEFAELSHCIRVKVAAIIVKDKRILSTGINGTPSGFINCDEVYTDTFKLEDHHKFSENYECHAEMSAIIFAARNGINISGSSIYCSVQPCINCLKYIVAAGIKNIYYNTEYDRNDMTNQIPLIDMLDNYVQINV